MSSTNKDSKALARAEQLLSRPVVEFPGRQMGGAPNVAHVASSRSNPSGAAASFVYWVSAPRVSALPVLTPSMARQARHALTSELFVLGRVPLHISFTRRCAPRKGQLDKAWEHLGVSVAVDGTFEELQRLEHPNTFVSVWSRRIAFGATLMDPREASPESGNTRAADCNFEHDRRVFSVQLEAPFTAVMQRVWSPGSEALLWERAGDEDVDPTLSTVAFTSAMLCVKVSVHVHHDAHTLRDHHKLLARITRQAVGAVGIVNGGATCFANALLQVVFHATPFRDAVFALPLKSAGAALQLQGIFHALNSASAPPQVAGLFEALRVPLDRQQDAHEFLSDFFLTRVLKRDAPLFELTTQYATECVQVSFTSKGPAEVAFELAVSPKRGSSVQAAVDAELCAEPLTDMYDTEVPALGRQQATRRLLCVKLPPLLFLHVKRFDSQLRKILQPVAIDEEIRLTEEPEEGVRREVHYKLYALVVHHGARIDCGHYTSFIRTQEGFLHFDDTAVYPVSAADMERTATGMHWFSPQSSAYILTYCRADYFAAVTAPKSPTPSLVVDNLRQHGLDHAEEAPAVPASLQSLNGASDAPRAAPLPEVAALEDLPPSPASVPQPSAVAPPEPTSPLDQLNLSVRAERSAPPLPPPPVLARPSSAVEAPTDEPRSVHVSVVCLRDMARLDQLMLGPHSGLLPPGAPAAFNEQVRRLAFEAGTVLNRVCGALDVQDSLTIEALKSRILLCCPNVQREWSTSSRLESGVVADVVNKLRLWRFVRRESGAVHPALLIGDQRSDGQLLTVGDLLDGARPCEVLLYVEIVGRNILPPSMVAPLLMSGTVSPNPPSVISPNHDRHHFLLSIGSEMPSDDLVTESSTDIAAQVAASFAASPLGTMKPRADLSALQSSSTPQSLVLLFVKIGLLAQDTPGSDPHTQRVALVGTVLVDPAECTVRHLREIIASTFPHGFPHDAAASVAEIALCDDARPERLDLLDAVDAVLADYLLQSGDVVVAIARQPVADSGGELFPLASEALAQRAVALCFRRNAGRQYLQLFVLDESLVFESLHVTGPASGPACTHAFALRERPLGRDTAGRRQLMVAEPIIISVDLFVDTFDILTARVRAAVDGRVKQLNFQPRDSGYPARGEDTLGVRLWSSATAPAASGVQETTVPGVPMSPEGVFAKHRRLGSLLADCDPRAVCFLPQAPLVAALLWGAPRMAVDSVDGPVSPEELAHCVGEKAADSILAMHKACRLLPPTGTGAVESQRMPTPHPLPLFVELTRHSKAHSPIPDLPLVVQWLGSSRIAVERELHFPRFPGTGSVSLLVHLCALRLKTAGCWDEAVTHTKCPTSTWVLSVSRGPAIEHIVHSCCPTQGAVELGARFGPASPVARMILDEHGETGTVRLRLEAFPVGPKPISVSFVERATGHFTGIPFNVALPASLGDLDRAVRRYSMLGRGLQKLTLAGELHCEGDHMVFEFKNELDFAHLITKLQTASRSGIELQLARFLCYV